MKKLYFILFVILLPAVASAQFSEDFEAMPVISGYGDLPAENGWVIYDQDQNIPYVSAFDNRPWLVKELSDGNYAAASTSYYKSPGKSDDWMVLPKISLPPGVIPYLMFDLKALDAPYFGELEVLVSTTGNAIADFTKLFEITSAEEFETHGVDLSAYVGKDVYVAFRNIANNQYIMAVDNIELRYLKSDDAKLMKINLASYADVNQDTYLPIVIKNNGGNKINSVEVTVNDGLNAFTETITGLSIAIFDQDTIALNRILNYTEAKQYQLSVTISKVNGNADSNPADNALTATLNVVSQRAVKRVVIEEYTGMWCGYCPRGVVAMHTMEDKYSDFIGIAVHDGDPLEIDPYHQLFSQHIDLLTGGSSGLPGSIVGRRYFTEANIREWEEAYDFLKAIPSPADIEISTSYNKSTRTLTAEVTAKFYMDMKGIFYRLGLIVTEDDVTGSSPDFDQHNFFYDGSLGPMGGFEFKPNYVNIPYDHVAIAMLGGYNGEAGSIPNDVADGDSPSYVFSYTLPAGSDPNNIKVVGLLFDRETRYIVNANRRKLLGGLGVDDIPQLEVTSLKIYPNPTAAQCTLSFSVEKISKVRLKVYSITGKILKNRNLGSLVGKQKVQVDLADLSSGEYLLSLETGTGSVTKTVIVK